MNLPAPEAEEDTPRGRLLGVSAIILSSSLMAFASGLTYTYIPIKLLSLGFEPWVAASMTPSVALGGLVGCFVTAPLLRMTGHARIFMLYYALIILSMIVVGLAESPFAWLAVRAFYGLGINGVFIVAQSWLHNSVTDAARGKVITAFYVGYVVALGAGAYFIGLISIEGNTIPMLSAGFVALALVPVALTRLPQPAPPEQVRVDIARVWRISPVGLAGMLAVGGLTMTLQGFTPIYMTKAGYPKADVGLMLLLMQIGLMFVQIPMGALSDRIDRRLVLIIVSAGGAAASIAAFSLEGAIGFLMLALLIALWNGFNETIYSVSSALANDRADPKDYVLLSATQMVAWSVSAFVFPLIATFIIQVLPIRSYMLICATVSILFGLFVLFRMRLRSEPASEQRESFQPVTAQVVYPGEFVHPEFQEEAAGKPGGADKSGS